MKILLLDPRRRIPRHILPLPLPQDRPWSLLTRFESVYANRYKTTAWTVPLLLVRDIRSGGR